MVETIESFVQKLQTEGVEAGRQQADKILSESKQQAEQIIQQAKQQAEKIVADAQAQAQSSLEKGKTELELAARDAILQLRNTLSKMLQVVLNEPVDKLLNNQEFLTPLLHDIIMQYAQIDSSADREMKINVSPQMSRELADWAINELRKAAQDHHSRIDLKGTLKQAGFEYNITGATIEVTVDSVIETLGDFLSARLKEVLSQAADTENLQAPA